jgi:DnaK suppressor protein
MSQHYPQDFIKNQKEKLLMLKQEILNSMRTKIDDDILVSPDQTVEDGDQAQTYLSQNVTFGLREREIKRLREIEAALERIERGTYGVCEESDEPIGIKRLEKMPWTRLSIEAAEALEREMSKVRAS